VLQSVQQLLVCWREMIKQGPEFLQVVVRMLLPLIQQLQGCGNLLTRAAAAAASHSAPTASVQTRSSSSSSRGSCEHELQCVLFGTQQAALLLLNSTDVRAQSDAGLAAEVLKLQDDPAVAEMQLQLLTAWTAQLHKQHTAQQQQLLLSPGTAASSSSSSSMQQRQQQPVKQQHRADLLPIPAFHQDMLQLLPGGQAYLDAAAEDAAGWGLDGEAHTVQLCTYAGICCRMVYHFLHHHLQSIAGQQRMSRTALIASGAALRLVLELQLLASGAMQRQREQQRQQQQQALPSEDKDITEFFALQTWSVLRVQIKALVTTSRSCLPPEVLQQAGLQLLQALAAPLQQWQLSKSGDTFLRDVDAAGLLPLLGETLDELVTAACGAERSHSQAALGEHDQWCSSV
jgi:hypothetical protein